MSDSLHRVAALVELMVEQAAAVAKAEDELARLKANFQRTEQEDLPELMREVGLTELKLEDGTEVVVSEEVSCAITEERRDAAHAWLRAHDFGGLIKTALSVDFAADEGEEAAAAAVSIAEELGREVSVAEKVHPSTLKSFVKEQLAAGVAIPFDLFGIHPFNKAKVKPPRVAKPKKAKAK